jgi:hypothetical protein
MFYLVDDTTPPMTLIDGLTAAVTCFAIDEAQQRGTVVDCRPYRDRVDA